MVQPQPAREGFRSEIPSGGGGGDRHPASKFRQRLSGVATADAIGVDVAPAWLPGCLAARPPARPRPRLQQ